VSEGKRLVVMPKRTIGVVDRIASVDGMFDDLLTLLQGQIEKQRLKADAATFTEKELKAVEALTDSLVKLSRESRERVKSDALSKALEGLTDEELVALAKPKKG
jgi:hypothetical protein